MVWCNEFYCKMSVNFLFYVFSFLVSLSAILSIVSKNSVHAVLYLVLTFFSSAWIMLLLNAEFLAMLLIIVYVGAIAVLFLFVVMMLQTNYTHKQSMLQTSTAGIIACVVFVQMLSFLFFKSIQSDGKIITNIPLAEVSSELYINNFVNFQIVGMILLVAMVAVILLTLEKSSTFTRRQKISRQVLRKKEDCIIMTKPEIGKGVKF